MAKSKRTKEARQSGDRKTQGRRSQRARREERVFWQGPPPPPPPPPPHGEHDVLMWTTPAPEEGADHEDILVRKAPVQAAAQFRAAAGARRLTYGEYLAALVELHSSMRNLARDEQKVASELERLGLSSVTV